MVVAHHAARHDGHARIGGLDRPVGRAQERRVARGVRRAAPEDLRVGLVPDLDRRHAGRRADQLAHEAAVRVRVGGRRRAGAERTGRPAGRALDGEQRLDPARPVGGDVARERVQVATVVVAASGLADRPADEDPHPADPQPLRVRRPVDGLVERDVDAALGALCRRRRDGQHDADQHPPEEPPHRSQGRGAGARGATSAASSRSSSAQGRAWRPWTDVGSLARSGSLSLVG